MNIQEQIDKLQVNIDNQQSQLDELKSQVMKCKKPEIDWSKMIGRLVVVRDRDTEEWSKPRVLEAYNKDNISKFYSDCSWYQCKLYEGPTRPNWIEWNGGECPVKGGVSVLVEFRDGGIDISRYALDYTWYHSGSDGDIIRYTTLEP